MIPYIDMHCDTLTVAYRTQQHDLMNLTGGSVDFSRMLQGNALAQCFAIFMPPVEPNPYFPGKPAEADDVYIDALEHLLKENVKMYNDILGLALSSRDIPKNKKYGKMSAILTMEDGRSVNGDMRKLKAYYDKGVRMLALTWNHENCFGAPNSTNPEIMRRGLTSFGKEAVLYMQELGMIVDVSHLSDGGFYDVASLAKIPFVASHSNCRSICPHERNMTDDMIRTLAEHGGVMGINFCPHFLDPRMVSEESRIEWMVEMAKHERKVGGIDVVALGSDFDGISGELEISGSDKMLLLADALQKEGFTEEEIDKVFFKNALRVFEEAM